MKLSYRFFIVISNKVRNLIEKSGDFSAKPRNDVHFMAKVLQFRAESIIV